MSKSQTADYRLVWPTSKTPAPDANVEVNNIIIEGVRDWNGLYTVDALSDSGWLRILGLECGETQRQELLSMLSEARKKWITPRITVLVGFSSKEPSRLRSLDAAEPSQTQTGMNHGSSNVAEWIFSAEEILIKLECSTTSFDDRISGVLFAETMAFSDLQKPRLLNSLFEFVEQNRFAKDDQLITAVGSAIRKFAMNMPTSEFERYSQLFSPTSTDTLSCETELELAKAVSWRLMKVNDVATDAYPNLERHLSELASDYLAARLILQENYASIAIHAVIAVALLNGARQHEFADRIAALGISWFSELVVRRLADVVEKRRIARSGTEDNLTVLKQRLAAGCRR